MAYSSEHLISLYFNYEISEFLFEFDEGSTRPSFYSDLVP